jgi:hypothetical protein
MFYLTMMGGTGVRLQESSNFVVTIMGGTEIYLPTMAERILRLKQAGDWGTGGPPTITRTTAITLMGATVWKPPTIAREIEEMIKLRESGAIPDAELLRLWQEVIRRGDFDMFETYTFMGGAGEEQPESEEEINDLERLAAKGLLSVEELVGLRQLIEGESLPHMRVNLIQQRIRTLLLPPATSRGYTTNPLETSPLVTGE